MEVVFQDIARASLEQERRQGAAWAGPVYCLPLALSVGEIAGDPFGPARRAVLRRLYGAFPQGQEVAEELLTCGEKHFRAVCQGAAQGDMVRIWCSDQPDEACGACWLLAALDDAGIRANIRRVPAPGWPEGAAGAGWGGAEPGQWAPRLACQQAVSSGQVAAAARTWAALCRENAPLRALINGRLCSVPDVFYDGWIRREIAAQPDPFAQAVVVGRVLGRYALGISDGLIALRMEEMIRSGQLEAVTPPPADGPRYHRLLRKTAAWVER